MFIGVQLKASSIVQSIPFPSISTHLSHLFRKQKRSHSMYETIQNFLHFLHPAQSSGFSSHVGPSSGYLPAVSHICSRVLVTTVKIHLAMKKLKHVTITGQQQIPDLMEYPRLPCQKGEYIPGFGLLAVTSFIFWEVLLGPFPVGHI